MEERVETRYCNATEQSKTIIKSQLKTKNLTDEQKNISFCSTIFSNYDSERQEQSLGPQLRIENNDTALPIQELKCQNTLKYQSIRQDIIEEIEKIEKEITYLDEEVLKSRKFREELKSCQNNILPLQSFINMLNICKKIISNKNIKILEEYTRRITNSEYQLCFKYVKIEKYKEDLLLISFLISAIIMSKRLNLSRRKKIIFYFLYFLLENKKNLLLDQKQEEIKEQEIRTQESLIKECNAEIVRLCTRNPDSFIHNSNTIMVSIFQTGQKYEKKIESFNPQSCSIQLYIACYSIIDLFMGLFVFISFYLVYQNPYNQFVF